MSELDYTQLVADQRAYFQAGNTRPMRSPAGPRPAVRPRVARGRSGLALSNTAAGYTPAHQLSQEMP
jgi:hypothetical protein